MVKENKNIQSPSQFIQQIHAQITIGFWKSLVLYMVSKHKKVTQSNAALVFVVLR